MRTFLDDDREAANQAIKEIEDWIQVAEDMGLSKTQRREEMQDIIIRHMCKVTNWTAKIR